MDLKDKITNLIKENEVCLFMKGTPESPQCGFSMAVNNLLKYLELEGFGFDKIEKTDLLIKNNNGEYFGRFSKRITFPIHNFSNDIVGFGARTIQNSKIKYINSQESLVFKKSQLLYGLKENLENIRSEKEIFLVEGYMDVIKMYSSGIKNAVSTLGTTLSEMLSLIHISEPTRR